MTADEIRAAIAADPALQALVPDTAAIAAHPVFAAHTGIGEYWLTDRGLVAELTTTTGDTALADAVLTKLDALAAQSRSVRAVMNRLENDALGVDFGHLALRAQIQALGQQGVFTTTEVAALLALAVRPAPVSEFDIRCALFADDGSLLV